MRALSQTFMANLLNQDGLLRPILERTKQDHTLMVSIREGYINIYYRGGNILRVKEHHSGSYNAFFDNEYNKYGLPCPVLLLIISINTEQIQRDLHRNLTYSMYSVKLQR
jgi:hypothetical protein